MCKVVNVIGQYKIIRTQKDYVVINMRGNYENHGHFKKLSTCYVICRLLNHWDVPKKRYLIRSCIRITTDVNYKDTLVGTLGNQRQMQSRTLPP